MRRRRIINIRKYIQIKMLFQFHGGAIIVVVVVVVV
jgi:hypothetical protein